MLLHPERLDSTGPDVGIVEIEIPATHPLPPVSELFRSDDRETLHAQTVHLIGIPGVALPNFQADAPFYGRGMISQIDKGRLWIGYDMAAGHGASGSPVFVLRPGHDGREVARVIGVQSAGEMFSKLSWAVHVRHLAKVLQQTSAVQEPVIQQISHSPLRAVLALLGSDCLPRTSSQARTE
jgi:hypothetical protein